MNNYKVYEQFFAKVVEDGNYRRRGKVFQTRNRFYYYDTGTGKVYGHILDEDRKKNARLMKVLGNPEMAALLTSLAKSMKG